MKLTKTLILDTAEAQVLKKGFQQTTLSDIAKSLSVSHAALYKYYKNKEDLFENLALRWLETSMASIFTWQPTNHGTALHDWLWLITTTKKKLHHSNPKMFKLYTEYIENNEPLVAAHVQKLADKAESIDPLKNGAAVITAFTYFHNPYFAARWDKESYQEDFEALWTLIAE